MEEVHPGDGFAVINKDEQYFIEWPQGPFDQVISYPITKELMDKAFRSADDAYAVMIYAETGLWPTKNTEDDENDRVRQFVRENRELLITVPDNQFLFSEEELKKLLPIGEKIISEQK